MQKKVCALFGVRDENKTNKKTRLFSLINILMERQVIQTKTQQQRQIRAKSQSQLASARFLYRSLTRFRCVILQEWNEEFWSRVYDTRKWCSVGWFG